MLAAAELSQLYRLCLRENLPFLVLGGGSNILFGDQGFPGLVARLTGAFAEFRFDGETAYAGSGVRLPAL
ncbi:MAG: FAD-binding protein, partial [Endomicrobiales bacterium]